MRRWLGADHPSPPRSRALAWVRCTTAPFSPACGYSPIAPLYLLNQHRQHILRSLILLYATRFASELDSRFYLRVYPELPQHPLRARASRDCGPIQVDPQLPISHRSVSIAHRTPYTTRDTSRILSHVVFQHAPKIDTHIANNISGQPISSATASSAHSRPHRSCQCWLRHSQFAICATSRQDRATHVKKSIQ